MTEAPGGGGAAPAPRAETNGGPPAITAADLPAEIAQLLPEGFELPPGFAFIQVPEPSPEQKVLGAAEHAAMQRGLLEAAQADLEITRQRAAGLIEAAEAGVEKLRGEAAEAEQRAERIAAEQGLELPPPGQRPRLTIWDTPPADESEQG
jgi:hypothetical protein